MAHTMIIVCSWKTMSVLNLTADPSIKCFPLFHTAVWLIGPLNHQRRSVDTLREALDTRVWAVFHVWQSSSIFLQKNILFATKGWRLLAVSGNNRASCRAAPFPSIIFGTGSQVLYFFFLTEIQVCWYTKIEIYFLIFLFVNGNMFELCKSWARIAVPVGRWREGSLRIIHQPWPYMRNQTLYCQVLQCWSASFLPNLFIHSDFSFLKINCFVLQFILYLVNLSHFLSPLNNRTHSFFLCVYFCLFFTREDEYLNIISV